MDITKLTLHSQFQVGEVDPRIFGGFLEHMGRAVYQGVYEPESAHADEHGFRQDVMSALRSLRMTAMRYPGGNFASGYHWMDGIGPKSQRPVRRELAWQSIEPNQFGTDEYLRLCRKMDWTLMLTVNLGTGTPEEARNWVVYCNAPSGTHYSNMRADNGNLTSKGLSSVNLPHVRPIMRNCAAAMFTSRSRRCSSAPSCGNRSGLSMPRSISRWTTTCGRASPLMHR